MKYWLMKAEPNSRIDKGKDVKFSVDDFESVQTTAWEGVRNHEAKKLMQSMKVGDQVLFYHSNCKNPGVADFEGGVPGSEHPYYDAKSDKDSPRWFMVDVTFKARTTHPVPLSLFKRLANAPTDKPPVDVAYIGEEDMALIKRGRLSVQPVEEDAWKVVQQLAEKGGWDEEAPTAASDSSINKGRKRRKGATDGSEDASSTPKRKTKARVRGKAPESKTDDGKERGSGDEKAEETKTQSKKRKADAVDKRESGEDTPGLRRSTRRKR